MKNKKIFNITYENLANFSFIIYFSNLFFISFFSIFKIPYRVSIFLTILMIYVPLLILFYVDSKKYFKVDFFVIYILLILLFMSTWLLHPEYTPYYLKKEYGLWDTVFFPTHGVYTYLFIRIINNPNKILKNIKISGYIMIFYFINEIYLFSQRGFWYGVIGDQGKAEMSYSVSFGYQLMIFLLAFLYSYFKYKKKQDMLISGIYIIMLFFASSRGPVLCIIYFIIIYFVLKFLKRNNFLKYKNKIIIFLLLGSIIYYFKNNILMHFINQINEFGIRSRFINTVLTGSVFNDNGRSVIWDKAIEMLKDRPFGYGVMGTRYTISNIIFAGYPHSIVLEILLDFGIFFGSVILFLFLINILIMFFDDNRRPWRGIFLIFLSCSFGLLLSLTYWNSNVFWGSVGIVVASWINVKNKSRDIFLE